MERDEEQKLAQNQSANPLYDLKNSNDPEISRTIEVLEELDNNELTKMLSVVMEKREVHIGPIPSAKELAAYKKVDKNAPGEIIGMAKERLRASIKNERTVTVVNCVSLILGQVFWSFNCRCLYVFGILVVTRRKRRCRFRHIRYSWSRFGWRIRDWQSGK